MSEGYRKSQHTLDEDIEWQEEYDRREVYLT
jgi:hypothetical protein